MDPEVGVAAPQPKPYSFQASDPERLKKEIEELKAEMKLRNRKIEELLAENKSLWQKIRTLDV